MRRSLPFVLFGIAVLTALWLSAQPDQGRPAAGPNGQESGSDVSAGPSGAPAGHTGVWPPDSRMEVTEAPRVSTAPPVSAPPPAAPREVDPAHAAALRALNAEPDHYPVDEASNAPAFDAAAFRNTTPGSTPTGAAPPPVRSAPFPVAFAGAPPSAPSTPSAPDVPEQPQPQKQPISLFGSSGPEIDPTLPERIRELEAARIKRNQDMIRDLTDTSRGMR